MAGRDEEKGMTDKWDERFLNLADEVSTWSKDPSTQCGCVLVDGDRRVVATGFNGFPRGMSDDVHLYADRETKYKRVLHAEVNAVLNATVDPVGTTAYVSAPCCSSCALVLIQAGINRVVFYRPSEDILSRWGESISSALSFFEEAGVEVTSVGYDEQVH